MDKMVQKPNYVEELLEILRSSLAADELQDQISDYHESDIADAFEQLTEEERKRLYPLLGPEWIAEIFTYIEDPDEYLKELDLGQAAQVLSYMDSDDAVDVLDELDDTTQEKLVGMMDEESSHDIKMLQSYEDDEVGSLMTTNFIVIHENLTIRQAMRELIRQAGENDNISTVYVIDKNDQFYGAIDLKDLIIAREKDALEDIISTSYPYVTDHEKIDDCIEQIKDYAEDSIPVLTEDKQLIGVITAQDLVEVVDDAMGEDYAKLAGLTAEEDLEETTTESMKKRLPWLVILLFLGLAVSTVVGVFETVVAVLPIVMCFQSLILDMAGNVGTQSLAVTIRVLMDDVGLVLGDADPAVTAGAIQYLAIMSMLFCFHGLLMIFRNTLQGLGYSVQAIISGVGELIGRSLGGLLAVKTGLGYVGICLSNPFAWGLAMLYCMFMVRRMLKREE